MEEEKEERKERKQVERKVWEVRWREKECLGSKRTVVCKIT